jgi:sialidase-1
MIIEGKAPRTVWVTSSEADGLSWRPPREITAEVKRPEWTWYATGPCHGVQLQTGRLVIPCDHMRLGQRGGYSHVIFSDDYGHTWRIGGVTDEGTDESTVVETTDGWVYLNCRNASGYPGPKFRAVAWSRDGGESFAPLVRDAALPEPICQASVCRYTDAASDDRNRVLFSNPAFRGTQAGDDQRARRTLTVRLSYDECRTWPVAKVLHEGAAAYSDLCIAPDGQICCLYECGEEYPYARLTLARFSLAWLTDGLDRLKSASRP